MRLNGHFSESIVQSLHFAQKQVESRVAWHCILSFSSFLSCQTQLRGPWWYSCEKVVLWHNLIDVRFWSGEVSEWVTTHYYYTLCLFIGGYSILIDTNHATLNKSFFFFRSSSLKSCVWNESEMKYIVTSTRF